MGFAVIGLGFKSMLLMIERSINVESYQANLEASRFLELLNELDGRLQWIFQSD
jgi:hypothetical protein